MPTPSCTITVTFFDQSTPSFMYFCDNSPPAWHVGTDGTVRPSIRSRIIRFDLASVPPGVQFAGIRIALDPHALGNTNDPYFNDPSRTHITIEHQATAAEPYIVINDDSATPSELVWYAVGVTLNGVEHWDDPKIYNPPDD